MIFKGRVSNLRKHGSILFLDLRVQGKDIQGVLAKDITLNYDALKKELFVGAIVKIQGEYKKDKDRVEVKTLELRSKPYAFPTSYPKNEIKDLEIRYKDRVLDLITNVKKFNLIKVRFQLIESVKNFLKSKKLNKFIFIRNN